jgi:hypothetical protein
MNARKRIVLEWLVGLLVCGGLAACHETIVLSSKEYYSEIQSRAFSVYGGKEIYMPLFKNEANDTSRSYWYGEDSRLYGGESLRSLFWDVFKENFSHIGVRVYESDESHNDPVFELTLTSITEKHFEFSVTLTLPDRTVVSKPFRVVGPAIRSFDERSLKKRAYRMMDEAFLAVVQDPEIKAAFLRPRPQTAPPARASGARPEPAVPASASAPAPASSVPTW